MTEPDARPVILEARVVTFAYTSGTPVLQEWSAAFTAGSMTALTAPSGRGKSTLLYLLGLMLRPDGGDIKVEGRSTARLPDAEKSRLRAETFGFVFQDAALDPTRSVIDNITEASLYRGQSRRTVTGRAHDLMERFAVDVPSNRRPGEVSGGQAQRIALCRALLGDPKIVLADEPTGNLDAESASAVVRALRSQADSGSAVVVVTHSAEVADACDREVPL